MLKKISVPVSGLHCKACVILTEDALKDIEGVKKAEVSLRSERADIFYEGEEPSRAAIKERLEEAGYRLGSGDGSETPLESRSLKRGASFGDIVTFVSSILILLWILNRINIDPSSWLNRDFSWPLAVIIGLVAGVSTCLALTGGLVMGLAANYAKDHPEAGPFQKFKPHLLFNAGRFGGFFLLGGILGLVGEAFKLSVITNSLITIVVGLVILILGLKILDIFPSLNHWDISLPKRWSRILKINNPIILGALTFFVPCGFTQAMQLYALNSGGFFQGGLVMALFALGTAPGLLGIGGLSSLLGKKNSLFFKIAGIVIIAFALFNLNNGYKLLKISGAANLGSGQTSDVRKAAEDSADRGSIGNDADTNNIQIVRMTETGRGYSPNRFIIIKDKPVRWIITAEAPYSCASALIVPSFKIQKQLERGENIIEFTPTKIGPIPFSCSMGMYTGSFQVVEK
ncbi:MAG: sulfite exporter TauE/SafE family protein [Patescibacteria group bacterium]|jgi:sulfite exporter TauE/SafE/copper chaperone CopZ